MRAWVATSRGQAFGLLAALAVGLIVGAVLVVTPDADGGSDAAPAPKTVATSTPVPVTPAPSATGSPETPAEQDAGTSAAAPPAAAAPAPAAPPALEPGVIGMDPGDGESCGEYPNGQTIYRPFSWTAREGNTVDVYVAYTDADVTATSGFMPLALGQGTTGTVQIPRTCPVGEGPVKLVTIRVVASVNGQSATAYWSGL